MGRDAKLGGFGQARDGDIRAPEKACAVLSVRTGRQECGCLHSEVLSSDD